VLDSFPTLDTSRLLLREIVLSDAPSYLAIFGDAEHMHWFGAEPASDLAAAQAAISTASGAHRLASPHVRWGIEAKDGRGGLIGSCGLFAWNKKWKKGSLGFALGRDFQGKGYMYEALAAVLSWGFDGMGLNRIDAQVHPRNERSRRLLSRLSFVEEGRLRQLAYWDEQYHDMLQYSLLRLEWKA
jgi:ribosomal-protein-alanine N-acetyltransferase